VIYDENNEEDSKKWNYRNVTAFYKDKSQEDGLQKVFGTFNFETVIFFSHAIDGAVYVLDELEKLEGAVYESLKCQVKNFIYITSNDLSEEDRQINIKKSHIVLMNACKELCESAANERIARFMVLKIPYLYNMTEEGSQLDGWILEAIHNKEIVIKGARYTETDFLCDEDLGTLLARIIDEPSGNYYEEMHISGENLITFQEFTDIIKKDIQDICVIYKNQQEYIPCYKKDRKAREDYGWYPKHILQDDIHQMIKDNIQKNENRHKLYENKKRRGKWSGKIRVTFEIIAVFLLAEALNYFTRDNVLVNFIDFRLVFVMMMGTMNGLKAGVVASFLSCIGYVSANAGLAQWEVIFYNVENWLPFTCYFLLGSISGYTKDRHEDEIRYAKDEHDILERKYIFLNELYNRVLVSKDTFNSQIIGYKDSFGKVYSMVKKLDTTLPDQVFYEAVNILEELLENNSVAIYSVNGYSDFARLNVCSKQMNQTITKSMRMSALPKMMEYLNANKNFVNTECLEQYPAYAAPIQRDGKLLGIIILMSATDRQMNMEFSNKFNIISELISNSLIRAMKFENLHDNYIEGTQILKQDKFNEVLAVKEQMKEKQYLNYVLLKLLCDGDKTELSDRVAGLIRNNDVMGSGSDGEVYILLSQTRRDDLEVIGERMKKNGISFEVVKG
jgi:hypothetical protein